jgi:predicted nuclease of predicted toxin-antitoxin system
MKFLVDESAPARLVTFLASEGHDVTRVASDYPSGLSDEQVLALAVAEQRVVITNDRDFSDVIVHQKHAHAGLIYFRTGYLSIDTRIAYLQKVLQDYRDDLDQVIVITPGGRIRVHRSTDA